MKEYYRYAYSKDGVNVILGIVALIFSVLFILVFIVMPDSDNKRNIRVGILTMLIPLITFLISDLSAEADFSADDHAVTFRHMSRKTLILYENIKSIELKTECRKEKVNGSTKNYYAEVMTFHCADGKDHTFAGKSEKAVDVILEHPCYLQRLPGNSKFANLKRYIENKMNTKEEN